MSHSELAASYAALILADDEVEITADKLQTLIKAANVEDVESIWTTLFAKACFISRKGAKDLSLTILAQALDGKNVKDMLLNVGSGGGAAAAPAAGGAAGGATGGDAPAEAAKEEKKEEEKEESDEDMGFGLFD